jgi:hypothetical protein
MEIRTGGGCIMNAKGLSLTRFSTEMDDTIIICLTEYWSRQGLTREQAKAAAYKALEKLRRNADDRTWCLLPDQE